MKKSKLRIVLIKTEGPRNLGSVARAMGNFGFKDLVLVNPLADREHTEAKGMAMTSYPLLAKAKQYSSLTEAVSGFHWVIGFTRRAGRQRREFMPLADFATDVHQRLESGQKVALVYGTEKSGFTTEEAATCHRLVQIPTNKQHPSMNLAMATMISLYELVRTENHEELPIVPVLAPHQELEGMYGHLQEVLEAVHFFDAQNRGRIPAVLRRLLNRAEPTRQEVRIVRGLCRNTLNLLRKNS